MIKSTMRRKIISFIAIGICLLFLETVHAQSQQKAPFLYQVGTPDSLYSNILQEQRDLWLELPESYDPSSPLQYPVVFVLDGGVQMKGLLTVYSYYQGHHLPDMILVGIANRTNRTRDLTTSQITTRNGGAVNEETGGAEKFTEFIQNELIPYVEKKYKASSYRTLIGHSYGGLFTVNTLINHGSLFDNYIAIDPSLDWDDQKLLKQAMEKLQQENFKGKSLFVSLGAGQLHMFDEKINLDNVMQDTSEYTLFGRSIIEFSNFASEQPQNELNFTYKYYPADYHWTVSLPTMTDGLVKQFEWYQLKSAAKYGDPETSLEEILKLIKEREKELNSHYGYESPPLAADLLNQAGYMYMQLEQFDKSYAFFKMYVDYYPQDANAYDSMADYYESQKDFSNALDCVSKAYKLSGSALHKSRMEGLKTKK